MPRKEIRKPRLNKGLQVKVTEEQLNPDPAIVHPVFCFRYLHSGYGIEQCSDEQKVTFLNKLQKLSSMTWNDIKLAPRHGLGTEKIYTASLNTSLPEFISDDVNFLLAFRCFGLMPFLGHRNGPILHVLYIDPAGEVYDH